jgi:hypothetical protein
MSIGQEVIYRVSKTQKGYKVAKKDGRGLADGILTIPLTRYFYPSDYGDAEQVAHDYAEREASEIDCARVVRLGEKE